MRRTPTGRGSAERRSDPEPNCTVETKPTLLVFNKIDLSGDAERAARGGSIVVSATADDGIDPLRAAIARV